MSPSAPRGVRDVLGISVGMRADAARERLRKIGRLEKEERRQQEVWAVADDRRFAHLIVGYDKDSNRVRYVTAKAREGDRRVRYGDVIDLKTATKTASTNNYKYAQKVAAHGDRPGYVVIARGNDPTYLTYLSLESLD